MTEPPDSPPRRLTVADLTAALDATRLLLHPLTFWHGSSPELVPNGHYLVDHSAGIVYVNNTLSGDGFLAALLDGLTELRTGSAPILCSSRRALAKILPLRRSRPDPVS